jgi:hypothetical protein
MTVLYMSNEAGGAEGLAASSGQVLLLCHGVRVRVKTVAAVPGGPDPAPARISPAGAPWHSLQRLQGGMNTGEGPGWTRPNGVGRTT